MRLAYKTRAVSIGVLCFGLVAIALAADGSASTGSGVDARTVITVLAAALSTVCTIYIRSVEAKVESKMDAEAMRLLVGQMRDANSTFLEQLKNTTMRVSSHDDKIHGIELMLARQHLTKEEVQQVIRANLQPVITRLDALQEKLDQRYNGDH